MKRTLVIIFGLIQSLGTLCQPGEIIDEIIGVVGNEIILKSELEAQALEANQGVRVGQKEKCSIFETTLYQKLLLHQARIDSITVTGPEIDNEIDRRLQYYVSMFGSIEEFEKFYGKSIIEWKNEFRDPIKERLMIDRIQHQLNEDVTITPAEVHEFFATLPQDSLPLINAQVEYSQIMVSPKVQEFEKLRTKQRLDSIKTAIMRGETSMTLEAAKWSEDPGSKYRGGCYDMQPRGSFVPEYEAAVFNTNEGEYSEIFETVYGYHFVKVVEKRGELYESCHILMKPEVLPQDVARASSELDSITNLIRADSLTFNQAATRFSDDENSANMGGKILNGNTGGIWHEINNIDPNVFFILDKLEVGQISDPLRIDNPDGSSAFVILKLENRKDAHKANLKDDYSIFQQQAEANKKNAALDKWVVKKITETYINIHPPYKDCTYQYNWLKE